MRGIALAVLVTALLAGASGGAVDAGGLADLVTIMDSPASLTSSTTATFTFTGTSGVTAFRCELDGAVPSPCTSPKSYTGLSQGQHKFVVRGYRGSVDLNISDTRIWTIDSIPPETTITTQVLAETKATSITLAFTASEPGTFQCKLDAGSYQPCTSPVTVSPGPGPHTFSVAARDAAQNLDPTPATASWTIKNNLSPVARVGFLQRPNKPGPNTKPLIGQFAVPPGLFGVDNVVLPAGAALKKVGGKLILPAGAVIPTLVEGKAYTFSGAGSTDTDGKIVHYEWSVFDGGGYKKKQQGSSAVFTASFANVGGWSAVQLVVVDDEGAGASTQFIVKIDANCVYEVVSGRFRAQADCFQKKTITKLITDPKNTDADAPVAAKTTEWSTHPAGAVALVNGFRIDPGKNLKVLVRRPVDAGSAAGAPGSSPRVFALCAKVTVPAAGAELSHGQINWKAGAGSIDGFYIGGQKSGFCKKKSFVPRVRALRITGVAGLGVPLLKPDRSAAIALWVALPDRLGGVTSDDPVVVTTSAAPAPPFALRTPASAGATGDFSFTVENADISPYFTVKKLKVEYKKVSDLWTVDGDVVIAALGDVEAQLSLEIQAESLKKIVAKVDNLNLCVAQLVCLQKLVLNIVLANGGDSFTGTLGLSVFQKVAGHSVATVDGSLLLDFPAQKPDYAKVSGDVLLFGALKAASGFLAVDTNGLLYARGQATLLGLKGIVSVEGKVEGYVEWPKVNVYGSIDACIADLACAGAEALVSTKGLAVCLIVDLEVADWRPGFAYEWGDTLPTIFFESCDVGPYKDFAAVSRGPYQLPPGGAPVSLSSGLPGAVIAVQGANAPPKITLIGPKGEQVATPAGLGTVREKPFWVVQVPATRTTYVAIGKPSAGTWKVLQQPGSSPVVKIRQADGIAPPIVDGKILGSGQKRTLSYSFIPRAGQTITFWEEAVASRGTPPEAAQAIGTVVSRPGGRRQRGEIAFDPADGAGGKRRIIAQVLQNGLPRRAIVLGTYAAPPAPPLGVTPSISVERSGRELAVSWEAAPNATGYTVRLVLEDGQRKLYHLVAGTRKILVRGIPSGVGGTVEVTSLRLSTGTIGPTKKAALST